jgi:hypothetical protein
MADQDTSHADARRRKKLALFVSAANPLFKSAEKIERAVGLSFGVLRGLAEETKAAKVDEFLKETAGTSARHAVLGVSHETLRKWSRLDVADNARDRETIVRLRQTCAAIGALLSGTASLARVAARIAAVPADARESAVAQARDMVELIGRFLDDYEDPAQSVHVYQTGTTLGIAELATTQRAVDAAIYAEQPLLRHAYYDDRKTADRQFMELGGLYRAWVRRWHGQMRTWMRCSLHVRYVLDVDKRVTIRVKLNLPRLFPSVASASAGASAPRQLAYWEYDGMLDVREQNLFIFLEKRDDYRIDYFSIITSRRPSQVAGANDFVGLVGRYLTAHQDSAQSVVSGPILLERIARAPGTADVTPEQKPLHVYTEPEQKTFMWDGPLELPPDSPDCARLDDLVARLLPD